MSIIVITVFVIISIIGVILLTSKFKLNAFISLYLASLFLAIVALPNKSVIEIIKDGFGTTMGAIGFLIIMGAIIAVILDKAGGALSIAKFILSKTGQKNAALALGLTGFITGMTIFCDSGFIILSALAKSVSAKSKIAIPFIAIVLACSLYSVHCLIPPHPGALAAAGIIKANIGILILVGSLFAIPGFIVSYYWVKWMTQGKGYLPTNETEIIQGIDGSKLPSAFLSFLPIVVPLILITANSLFKLAGFDTNLGLIRIVIFCGQPVIALSIGALLALLLLKNKTMKSVNTIFEQAIEKAGTILIITAAGGMFGMVIKETGIGTAAGSILSKSHLGLAIPFLMAFVMKTAQGSSTVAIITVAAIVAPMLPVLGLDSEWGKIFTMLAMGAGSMMISHANDSYFWVITKFSDIHADITLRVFSSATIVMGITVFIFVWITSHFIL